MSEMEKQVEGLPQRHFPVTLPPAPPEHRLPRRYLGTFIHPSRCKLLPGSLLWSPGEFILSRQKASVKCVAYSAGRPQVAGKQVEHLG